MARDFTPTDDLVNTSTPSITAFPFSFSIWFYPDDAANVYALCGFSIHNQAARARLLINGAAAGDPLAIEWASNSGATSVASTGAFNASEWNHGGGVVNSSSSASAYLNGVEDAGSPTAQNPFSVTLTRTSLGASHIGNTEFHHLNGKIAECGMWDVALTDDEMASLAAGYSPQFIRPANLLHYWPLYGNQSPEPDRGSQGYDMTVTGTSAFSHVPIMKPASYFIFPPVAGGVTTDKTLSAVAAGAASLDRQLSFNRAIAATALGVPAFARQIAKPLSFEASGLAALQKTFTVSRLLSAVASGAASLDTIRTALLSILASAAGSADLTRQANKALAFSADGAASLTRQGTFGRTLSATATGAASLGRVRSAFVEITAAATALASMARRITKDLPATGEGAATLLKTKSALVSMIATALGLASLQKTRGANNSIRDYRFLLDDGATIDQATIIGPDLAFSRTTDASLADGSGVFTVKAADLARFDHETVSPFRRRAFRAERAKANFLLRGSEFDDATWTKNAVTVTADAVTAPDGTSEADEIFETTANNLHAVIQSITSFPASTIINGSVWFKQQSRQWVFIQLVRKSGGTITGWFDLVNGVVGTTESPGNTFIEAWDNGWYRCNIRTDSQTGAPDPQVRFGPADADNSLVYTGSTSESVYVWGGQCEFVFETSGHVATSATDNRGADLATSDITNESLATGSMYAEVEVAEDRGVLIQCDDGSATGRIALTRTDDGNIHFIVTDTTEQVNLDLGNVDNFSLVKVACAWSANDFAASLKGGTAETDSSGTVPSGLTTFRVAHDSADGEQFQAWVRRVRLYDVRQTDAFLERVTGPGILSAIALGLASVAVESSAAVKVVLTALANGVANLDHRLTASLKIDAFADGLATLTSNFTIGRLLSATASGLANLTNTATFLRTLSATASGAASLTKQAGKRLTAIASGAASLIANLTGLQVTMTAVANGVASLKETVAYRNTLSAIASGTASLGKSITKTLSAIALGIGTVADKIPVPPPPLAETVTRWYKGLFRAPGKKGRK